MVAWSVSGEALDRIRRAAPGIRILARVAEPATPHAARFVSRIAGEIGRLYRQGVRDFEIAPFANEYGGGFGTAWSGGVEFGEWFTGVARRLREVFPEIRVGFPTLASGIAVDGRQAGLEEFIRQAEQGIEAAAWIGVAILLGASGTAGPDVVRFLGTTFPGKPVIVTAADTPEDGTPERRAIAFADAVRRQGEAKVEAILFGGLHPSGQPAARSWESARGLRDRGFQVEPGFTLPLNS
jgi:hypothetical protein